MYVNVELLYLPSISCFPEYEITRTKTSQPWYRFIQMLIQNQGTNLSFYSGFRDLFQDGVDIIVFVNNSLFSKHFYMLHLEIRFSWFTVSESYRPVTIFYKQIPVSFFVYCIVVIGEIRDQIKYF